MGPNKEFSIIVLRENWASAYAYSRLALVTHEIVHAYFKGPLEVSLPYLFLSTLHGVLECC